MKKTFIRKEQEKGFDWSDGYTKETYLNNGFELNSLEEAIPEILEDLASVYESIDKSGEPCARETIVSLKNIFLMQ